MFHQLSETEYSSFVSKASTISSTYKTQDTNLLGKRMKKILSKMSFALSHQYPHRTHHEHPCTGLERSKESQWDNTGKWLMVSSKLGQVLSEWGTDSCSRWMWLPSWDDSEWLSSYRSPQDWTLWPSSSIHTHSPVSGQFACCYFVGPSDPLLLCSGVYIMCSHCIRDLPATDILCNALCSLEACQRPPWSVRPPLGNNCCSFFLTTETPAWAHLTGRSDLVGLEGRVWSSSKPYFCSSFGLTMLFLLSGHYIDITLSRRKLIQ